MTKNKNKKKINGKNANKQRPQQQKQQIVYRDKPAPKNSILGDAGMGIGNFVSKIFGWGEYKLSQNSLLDSYNRNQVPFMHSSSESVVFRHREYIRDISSSAAFSLVELDINPGLDSTFPFLAGIAKNFQEYEFLGLVFEYKSNSADALNSTNTALGSIVLAAQYRSDAVSFVNKQQMLNEMWSSSTKPSENTFLPIECDPKERPMPLQYIRTAATTTTDQKLFDLATLSVASYGSQATAVVGELWVTYEVKLYKPHMIDPVDPTDGQYHGTAVTGISTSAYWGTSTGLNPLNLINTLGITFTTTTLVFPATAVGYHMVNLDWVGTSSAVTGPAIAGTNCTFPSLWDGATSYAKNTPAGTTSTTLILSFIVYIADPSLQATVTFSGGTLPTSPTRVNIFVTPMGWCPL